MRHKLLAVAGAALAILVLILGIRAVTNRPAHSFDVLQAEAAQQTFDAINADSNIRSRNV